MLYNLRLDLLWCKKAAVLFVLSFPSSMSTFGVETRGSRSRQAGEAAPSQTAALSQAQIERARQKRGEDVFYNRRIASELEVFAIRRENLLATYDDENTFHRIISEIANSPQHPLNREGLAYYEVLPEKEDDGESLFHFEIETARDIAKKLYNLPAAQ